ncbi:MAG: FliO/MopB family protein [Alphaproteobacteria bacterium]|nr:FliO/MopB family protein [Alphaproteobacteria bacterium]
METVSLFRVVLSLLFVLGLIGLSALLLRKLAQMQGWGAPRTGQPRRLQVIERLTLNPRQALLLVRRDDKEHLLLIGGNEGLLVESSIPAQTEGERKA